MSFQVPWYLLALLIIPLAIAVYLLLQRRRPKYAVRFTNLDLLANVVDKSPGYRRHVPAAVYLLAIAVLAIALARPEVNHKVPKEEATVVLVTDISGSMNSTDVAPTRLAAAQASAQQLLAILPAPFKVGLVAFSTGVRTVTEPTTDRPALIRGLLSLQAVGGTAMGDALEHTLETIRISQEGDAATVPTAAPGNGVTPTPTPTAVTPRADGKVPAVIILLSDGKQTLGQADPIKAANDAKAAGVPIFTIAVGTQDGVVDVPDQNGVMHRLNVPPDEETLKQIADITGGKFFSAPTASDLKNVYQSLGSTIGYRTEKREVTQWFALAGGLLVVTAGGLSLLWFNRFP